MLRSEILNTFIEASRRGDGHAMLVGFWRTAARVVSGVGAHGRIPDEVSLTRGDFTSISRDPSPGWTSLVMAGPTVRGPIQAGCAVAIFQNARPSETLRYFTLEAPTDPDLPWMVGEWRSDGSRANLGSITDVSTTSAMEKFVTQFLGLDAISDQAHLSPTNRPRSQTNESIDWRAEGAQAMEKALQGLRDRGGSAARSREGITWESSPSVIASDTVDQLLSIRASGGKALVMSAASVRGLMQETSSYVQFMWKRNGSLITEIQADYSYWGVTIPSSSWPELMNAGMEMPSSRSANFHQTIPKKTTSGDLIVRLTKVFAAFQSVIQPTGSIERSNF